MTDAPSSPTPSALPPLTVEEEVVSAEEYLLLSTAISSAEHGPAALSTYLSTSESAHPTIVLTVRPRPRFPPPLHAALLPHALSSAPLHHALSFPLPSFPLVRHLCAACGLPLDIPAALVDLVTALAAARPAAPDHRAVTAALSPSLWPHLLPFQRAGVLRAIAHMRGRVLFADDMGLGKTLQALAVAEFFRWPGSHPDGSPPSKEPLPVLIICPATLRDAWRTAVARWIPATDPAALHLVANARDFQRLIQARSCPSRDPWDNASAVHFVILAYDLLPKVAHLRDELRAQQGSLNDAMHFPIVIADECHTLRNKDTQRTKATLPFFRVAKRRILISGTPALSRPAELFPLFDAILTENDRPFLDHDDFVARYCGGQAGVMKAVSYVSELNLLLSEIMIRRAKIEVQNCLPPKVRRHVTIRIAESSLEPLARMKDELEQLKEQMKQPSRECNLAIRRRHNAVCQSLFHRTAYLKIPGVIARVQQLIREEGVPRKLLVFAHHLAVLDALEAFAEREDVAFIRLDGQTNLGKRAVLVESFQSNPSVRLGILSLAVAGTGLTLTAADVVVFAELSWIPSDLAQAEDRAHRIGRVGPVTMEYVIAPGTVDEMMWSAVRTKLSVLNKVVDGSEQKRKQAFDVSAQSGKRICISELDCRIVIKDAINATEANGDSAIYGPTLQDFS